MKKIILASAIALVINVLLALPALAADGTAFLSPRGVELERTDGVRMNANNVVVYYSFEVPVTGPYSVSAWGPGSVELKLLNRNQRAIDGGSGVFRRTFNAGTTYTVSATATGGENLLFRVSRFPNINQSSMTEDRRMTIENFTGAPVIPLYEYVYINELTERPNSFFIVEIEEDALYRFGRKNFNDTFQFQLYRDDFQLIVRQSANLRPEIVLSPGTYYLFVYSSGYKPGDEDYAFLITRQGEYGWPPTPSNAAWHNFIRNTYRDMTYGTFWARLAGFVPWALDFLIILILFLSVFYPYSGYLYGKYNFKMFGWPFYILVGSIALIVFPPMVGFDPLGVRDGGVFFGDTRSLTILFGAFAFGVLLNGLFLFIKSRKIIMPFIHIVFLTALVPLLVYFTVMVAIAVAVMVGLMLSGQMLSVGFTPTKYRVTTRSSDGTFIGSQDVDMY
ncbi:MAG: hypothetical protein FWD90_03675 [Defluviitaleaceae bacterium]|nr:hypothetical protein [Defluviitaleaceae bacterium]